MIQRNGIPETLTKEVFLGRQGFSLQLRLFTFFIVFIAAIMLTLLLILSLTGVFSFGLTESRIYLENELNHISESVQNGYGTLSLEGVSLSEKISYKIEAELKEYRLSPSALKENSNLIEPVLRSCLDTLLAALEKNAASAVFAVLDTTVNPNLSGSENSRAGLFMRNMEPNAINRTNPSIQYMRGPISIARERGIRVLPQWEMEFTVQPGDFFYTTIDGAKQNDALSRLYYWSAKAVLEGDYEEAMLLCVPLIASDNTVLGVCGFEVNSMLFKLKNTPYNIKSKRYFSILCPISDGTLDTSRALFAGNFDKDAFTEGSALTIQPQSGDIATFVSSDGSRFSGLYREIALYPKDSANSGELWAVAVMLPEIELNEYVLSRNIPMLLLLVFLLVLSIGSASFISRRYLAPVLRSIDNIKAQGLSEYIKTNIREIDDLFAFLAEKDAANSDKKPAQSASETDSVAPNADASAIVLEFSQKLETLSRAERAVFNLYVQGYDAQEIAKLLCLSINTIKTHNKRIYYKLGVNSRKELMGYLRKMREKGYDVPIE